jgi:hypothetical protein
MNFTVGDEYTKSQIKINRSGIDFHGLKLTEFDFYGHNILNVSLLENGNHYGNSGNGPIVAISFKNCGGTGMFINGEHSDEINIEFRGISERNQLISALELIVNELKKC